MKKLILIAFSLILLTFSSGYCDDNKKNSVKSIKKEIKHIDDTSYHLNTSIKIYPIKIEDVPVLLTLEMKYDSKNLSLKKIKATTLFMDFSIVEEYYFKDNYLISYKITDYAFKYPLHTEIGYAKNIDDLVLYKDGEKKKVSDQLKNNIKDKTRESIKLYLKINLNN